MYYPGKVRSLTMQTTSTTQAHPGANPTFADPVPPRAGLCVLDTISWSVEVDVELETIIDYAMNGLRREIGSYPGEGEWLKSGVVDMGKWWEKPPEPMEPC